MVARGRWFTRRFFIGSETFGRLRSSKYTPSVSHSLDSSLREGAGNGWFHSSGYSLKSGVTGDFHRPYETQKFLPFTIHRTTLPQSRPLGVTAPSGREPGMGCVPLIEPPGKSNVAGDFHRPYGGSECLGFYHSLGGGALTKGGDASIITEKIPKCRCCRWGGGGE